MDHNAMAAARDQVRYQIIEALKEPCLRTNTRPASSDTILNEQADAVLGLLTRVCTDTDMYHLLMGYLNTIRLRAQEAESRHGEPSITEA